MTDQSLAISRIYAKAVFDFSKDNNNINNWQSMLTLFATISQNNLMQSLFYRCLDQQVLSRLFIAVCEDYQGEKVDCFGKNLIDIMVENHRLSLLPMVLKEFNYLKNQYERILSIEVVSARYLSNTQLTEMITILSRWVSNEMTINIINKIDFSILGGIIIRIGDTIIDGSIRGRILRLNTLLSRF